MTLLKDRKLPVALRALRHRNFQLFFGGQFISLIGSWMQTVAQSWLVYRLTGSSLELGLIGFCSQIPVFILAPLGGAVADRHNRWRIVIFTQICAMLLAFVLAALTLSGHIHVWHLYVLATLLGVVNAFDIPARQAFIVEMVGKDDLTNAIALNSSMFNGARIAGPAIAGILVSRVGEGWCFFINAVSYIAVLIGLFHMTIEPHQKVKPGNTISHIIEGFQYVWATKPIVWLLSLIGIVSLMGMPYSVLMPIFADKVLHSGSAVLGMLMGSAGCGALLGALILASRTGLKGLGAWLARSSAAFGVSLILFSFSHLLWLSMTILILTGFSMMIQMASTNTLIQSMCPDRLRGRVMSVYSMMFMGMAPFGALFAGFMSKHFSAPITVAFGGVVCIISAGIFASRLSEFRLAARELIIAQEMAAGQPIDSITSEGGAETEE